MEVAKYSRTNKMLKNSPPIISGLLPTNRLDPYMHSSFERHRKMNLNIFVQVVQVDDNIQMNIPHVRESRRYSPSASMLQETSI